VVSPAISSTSPLRSRAMKKEDDAVGRAANSTATSAAI
jgi:hypothetical protein